MPAMRVTGVAASAHGFGKGDHLCWAYRRTDEYLDGVVTFLREGLALGQRGLYMAERPETALLAELAALDGADELIARGALQVRPLTYDMRSGTVGAPAVVDVDEQVVTYARATQTAVDDGFTGLRAAVDATPLVRTAAQREAFGRWEHVADRFIRKHPFAALCAYDVRAIGDEAIDEMACLHPRSWGAEPAFHLHASPVADVALSGDVDAFAIDTFTLALERTVPAMPGDDLVIDTRDLTFIDHRGLLALARHGRRLGVRGVVLLLAPPIVHCLLEMVDVPLVRLASR
jgi:hypothetical protein